MDKHKKVLGVEAITNLMSRAFKTDVFEGGLSGPAMDPVAEDSLVGFAKLPSPSHDPAAVDPHGEAEGCPVLQGQLLAGQLARPVEGNGCRRGKIFRYPAEPGRAAALLEDKGALLFNHRKSTEGRDRVNPTGAEQDHPGRLPFADFQKVYRSPEVVLQQFAAAGLAIHPSENAGIGGGVDDPIDATGLLEVLLPPDVPHPKLHPSRLDDGAVELTARATEVIKTADLVARLAEAEGQLGTNKAADAADQNFHGVKRI